MISRVTQEADGDAVLAPCDESVRDKALGAILRRESGVRHGFSIRMFLRTSGMGQLWRYGYARKER
jgi:hypothetical protein